MNVLCYCSVNIVLHCKVMLFSHNFPACVCVCVCWCVKMKIKNTRIYEHSLQSEQHWFTPHSQVDGEKHLRLKILVSAIWHDIQSDLQTNTKWLETIWQQNAISIMLQMWMERGQWGWYLSEKQEWNHQVNHLATASNLCPIRHGKWKWEGGFLSQQRTFVIKDENQS